MLCATMTMSAVSSSTMTPPAPRKVPLARGPSKSMGVSSSSAVMTGVDTPPGMTALSLRPPLTPPAAAKISLRGVPMGNS